MIRQILSQELTELANAILPDSVADAWGNVIFLPLFSRLRFITPHFIEEDSDLLAIAKLEGSFIVRLYTDALAPIDPTPLLIALTEHNLFIPPNHDIPIGDYTCQLHLSNILECGDLDLGDKIVAQISADLGTNCYIYKKRAIPPIC